VIVAAGISRQIRLTEYRCYIKEMILYGAAGADTSSRTKSFVCQTTPHYGSTSREVPTLFAHIIHHAQEKVNKKFADFGKICLKRRALPPNAPRCPRCQCARRTSWIVTRCFLPGNGGVPPLSFRATDWWRTLCIRIAPGNVTSGQRSVCL